MSGWIMVGNLEEMRHWFGVESLSGDRGAFGGGTEICEIQEGVLTLIRRESSLLEEDLCISLLCPFPCVSLCFCLHGCLSVCLPKEFNLHLGPIRSPCKQTQKLKAKVIEKREKILLPNRRRKETIRTSAAFHPTIIPSIYKILFWASACFSACVYVCLFVWVLLNLFHLSSVLLCLSKGKPVCLSDWMSLWSFLLIVTALLPSPASLY